MAAGPLGPRGDGGLHAPGSSVAPAPPSGPFAAAASVAPGSRALSPVPGPERDGPAAGLADAGAAGAPVHEASPAAASVAPADSERRLLQRARRGDVAAFEQLLAPLMQPALVLAVRLLGDRQLAEDVAQDALLKAFTGIRHFRGDARFATWIFRIVHNACTDAIRYRARRPQASLDAGGSGEHPGPAAEPADPAPGPEDVALERHGRAALLAAITALSPEYRAVVLLRDVQGLSYEEVAAITGQNLGTVKSRLHRARAALRTTLGPEEGL